MIAAENVTWAEIERAGRVLFGPAFAPTEVARGGFRARLRAAYHRRVLETHPDRARALGRDERELVREFRLVAEAYRILGALRAAPARPARGPWTAAPPSRTDAPPDAATGAPPPRARAERGQVPHRRLRLAEYLYFTGRIPWSVWVEAVVWQRRQRPAMGRLAVELGFLEAREVLEILSGRRRDEAAALPFGEYAIRTGRLTPFQVLAVLGAQRRRQRPIGQYFVECGLLRAGEVAALVRELSRHNARWPRPA